MQNPTKRQSPTPAGSGAVAPVTKTSAQDRPVRFVLIEPMAHEVFVAGSFNDWNPTATSLIDIGHGRWVKEMWLPPGRYEYQFVVDGRWLPDRTARDAVLNPFGGLNSILRVSKLAVRPAKSMWSRQGINRKWAWHYRALLRLRDRLLADRTAQLSEAAEPLEPHSMSLADSASDQLDHDLALSELSAGQNALYELDAALRRIQDGSYGKCEATGKSIPAARLRAIPWARFCKEVEDSLERKDSIARPRLGELASVRGPVSGATQ